MSETVGGYHGSAATPPPSPEGPAASVNPSLTGVVQPKPAWTATMRGQCPVCGAEFSGPISGVTDWPPPPLNAGCSMGHDEARFALQITRTDDAQ